MRIHALVLLAAVHSLASAQAQRPKIHQLPATPTTVAYGYYWSEAKPAIRINSGDVVELETMLTNNPTGLERLGVKPEECIVLEDAEKGVLAAHSAGMRCIAVPNDYTRHHDFSRATRICSSLKEITPELLQSLEPLATSTNSRDHLSS